MKKPFIASYPKVKLHAQTVKCIKKGHPWVTADQFSRAFPKNSQFLVGKNEADQHFVLLMNDPNHAKVLARVWKILPEQYNTSTPFSFEEELQTRIEMSVKKRLNDKVHLERDNFYLCFGEADQLPGLNIQCLHGAIIIQTTAFYWKQHKSLLIESLTNALVSNFPHLANIPVYFQTRNTKGVNRIDQWVPDHRFPAKMNFEINEFGLKYKIRIGTNYDFGIYSDMSSVRKRIIPYLKKSSSVLNLFSYTGAFSLMALQHGAKQVVSVDLSEKYNNWCMDNIQLNPDLNAANHKTITSSVAIVLKKMLKSKEQYDFIICDPPSASSDSKQVSNALNNYQNLLPLILKSLSNSGIAMIALNTHSITKQKFKNQISKILSGMPKNNSYKIIEEFGLGADCKAKKGFNEGDYLKVLLIQKKHTHS